MMYDVVVIGGGPAGMMAAGRAGQLGQSVLLLEKNKDLGVKLLMTGKDRCNVTHFSEDKNELIEAYGKEGKFLYSAFAKFGNKEVVDFFENRGVKLKVERGNRVFPVSDKSSDIRWALLNFLKKHKVKIETGATVSGIISGDILDGNNSESFQKTIKGVVLTSGEKVKAKKYIVTTGGLSYPATGCTGDGYGWAEKLGHKIVKPRPALSPIVLTDWFAENLEGLSLKNIELSIYTDNNPPQAPACPVGRDQSKKTGKIDSKFGEMLFTKNGISGPVVLDLSKKVGELLESHSVIPLRRSYAGQEATRDKLKITGDKFYNTRSNQKSNNNIALKLDLKPALDFKKLDQRIQRDFQQGNNKQFKNILDRLLPKKLIPVVIKLSKINSDKQVNLITREERKRLVRLLKEFPLHPKRLVGFGKAIITTGGVDLKEVNSKTMQSRLVNNLYFAGEVLNLDGPTGGYNLQVAWSTGYVAGDSSVQSYVE